MKMQIYFVFFVIYVFCAACAQTAYTQSSSVVGNDFDKLSLTATLNKTEYLPLEPIFVKLTVVNKTDKHLSTSTTPSFTRIKLKVRHNGNMKVFDDLFLLGQPNNGLGIKLAPSEFIEREVILEKDLNDYFPEVGQYRVQILLNDGAGKEIQTEAIKITIGKPAEINENAINFLKQNQHRALFWWKDDEKGQQLLETFVLNYSESVFGDYARYQLASLYFNEKEFGRAKAELDKAKSSSNTVLAREAKELLTKIAQANNSQH